MAKNTVKVDVVVDDKGTLKQVGSKAKQAAKGLDGVATGAGSADRAMKGVSQQSANSTKNFSKMAQGMSGGIVPAYAILASNIFALSAAFNFLKDAGDLKVLEAGQQAYAASTGIAIKSLSKDIVEATNSQISFRDASQAAAIGLAAGLNQQQLKDFGGAARDLSIILGRDVTDSFNRLIRGVTKAEPELLDELGIILRLEDATKKYAAALGKNVKDLTAFERSQAVANDVLEQANEKASSVLTDQEKLGNAIVKLGKRFEEEFINPLKTGIITVLIPIIEFLSKNLLGLAGVLTLLAAPIMKAIIPSMDDWANSSKAAAEKARESYQSVKKEIKELEIAQAKLRQEGQAGKAAQEALSGIKSSSSGIGKIQAGQFEALNPKEINALLAAAEKGNGAVKKMSDEMKVQYIAALRTMKAQTKTTTSAIKRFFKGLWNSIKIGIKGMEAQWKLAMATMQRAAVLTAKAIDLAFKAMGWVGWILIGIDTVKAAYDKLKTLMETEEEKKLRLIAEGQEEELAKINQRFKSLNEEITTMINKTKELEGLTKTGFLGNLAGNIDVAMLRQGLEAGSEESINTITNMGKALRNQGELGYAKIFEDYASMQEGDLGKTNEGVLNTIIQIISGLQEAGMGANSLKQSLKDRIDLENKLFSSLERTTPYDTLISKYDEIVTAAATQNSYTEAEQKAIDQVKERLKIVRNLRQAELGIADARLTRDRENILLLSESGEKNREVLESDIAKQELLDEINDMMRFRNNLEKLGKALVGDQLEADMARQAVLEARVAAQEKLTRLAENEMIAERRKRGTDLTGAQIETKVQGTQQMPSLFRDAAQRQTDLDRELNSLQELQDQRNKLISDQSLYTEGTDKFKEFQSQIALQDEAINKQNIIVEQARTNLSDIGRIGLEVGNTLTNSMASAFDGLIQGTMTAKEAFASMAKSMLQSIAKIISELLVAKLLTSALGGTSFGNFLNIPAGRYGGVMEPPEYRYGGVAQAYSMGGIARGRDSGYPAILHGTEAVVPLPNNRSIPVDLKGAGQNNNVVVNVSIDGQGNASQDKQASSNQGANLGAAIAAAVQKELQNQKRSGGILNPYGAA